MADNRRFRLLFSAMLMAAMLLLTAQTASAGTGYVTLIQDQFSYETADLEIADTSVCYWEFYGEDTYTLCVELMNLSRTRTVKKYVMDVETQDAYGFPLEETSVVVEQEILPGEMIWSADAEMCCGSDVYLVYVSISKVEYTVGSVQEMKHPVKGCWYID